MVVISAMVVAGTRSAAAVVPLLGGFSFLSAFSIFVLILEVWKQQIPLLFLPLLLLFQDGLSSVSELLLPMRVPLLGY